MEYATSPQIVAAIVFLLFVFAFTQNVRVEKTIDVIGSSYRHYDLIDRVLYLTYPNDPNANYDTWLAILTGHEIMGGWYPQGINPLRYEYLQTFHTGNIGGDVPAKFLSLPQNETFALLRAGNINTILINGNFTEGVEYFKHPCYEGHQFKDGFWVFHPADFICRGD